MNSSRVHFFVDDKCIWQSLKAGLGLSKNDPKNSAEVSWHSGDGSTKDGGNMTNISIEFIMDGWDSTALAQTVTVTGILADETKQLIQAMPAPASMSDITEAGAYCSDQGANSLTFTCTTVSTSDIVFNIAFQDAEYVQ